MPLRTAKEANMINITLVVGLWMVLGIATLVLAIYRWVLTAHYENDVVHLGPGEEKEIPRQASLARKMSTIDRWGKTMTIITAVIGLALASAYLCLLYTSPSPRD